MGCLNCKDKIKSEDGEHETVNERSPLLGHDSMKSQIRPIYNGGDPASVPSMTKTDEQSILSRILHKTTQNIIDVSMIEPHSLERIKYMEKIRQYSDKSARIQFTLPKQNTLTSVTHAPMQLLQAEPISSADVKLITETSQAVAATLPDILNGDFGQLTATLSSDQAAIAS